MSDVAPTFTASPDLYQAHQLPDDPNNPTPTNLEGWVNNRIVPTLTGFGNSMLLGIPQAVVEKLGGKEGVQSYIDSHPSYNAGGVAGDIASTMINPLKLLGGGLVKIGERVAPKIVEGAEAAPNVVQKIGQGMQNLGTTTGIKAIPGQAINNALQQTVRSVAGNDPDAEQHILQAGLIGGIGGLGTTALANVGKITTEAEKLATKSSLAGMDLQQRKLLNDFLKNSGNGSALSKVGKPEDFLNELADIKTKYNLTGGPGDDEKLAQAYIQKKSEWNQLDQLADANPDFVHNAVFDAGDSVDQSIQNAFKFGAKPQPGLVEDMYQGVVNEPNLAAKRQYLQQIIDNNKNHMGWTPGTEGRTSQASFMAAMGMRGALDDSVKALAEQSGMPGLLDSAKEWGPLQTLAQGNLRDQMSLPKESTGSPTAEKLFTENLLKEGGSGLMEGLARGGISGLIGSAASKVIPKVVNKFWGATRGPLQAINKAGQESGTFDKLGQVAQVAGGPATRLGGSLIANAQTDESQQPIDQATPESNNDPEAMLKNGINTLWMEGYGQMYGPPDPSSPIYQQFEQGVKMHLTHNGTSPIDMRLAAGIMFPDEEDKKAYLDTYEKVEKVKSLFPQAMQYSGFKIINSPEAMAADNALKDVYAEAVGGDKKGAENAYNRIMHSYYNPDQKKQLLLGTIAKSNPHGADLLKQAGVL